MTRNEAACVATSCPSAQHDGSMSSDVRERSHASKRKSPAVHPGSVLDRMYFPLGFPLRMVTNHPSVIAAADRSWSLFKPVFHRSPLQISIEVRPDPVGIPVLPPAPICRLKGSLLLRAADSENFVVTDLRSGRARGRVHELTCRCRSYFRYHFLEGAAESMLSSMHCVPLHAAFVRVNGVGILICGDSGAGKTTLTFAGARAGWTYICDDAAYLPICRTDRLVIGNCHQVRFRPAAAQLFPELARKPITPRASGKPSIEMLTSAWPGLQRASGGFVEAIVFLNRRSSDSPRLMPMQSSTVWPWFRQNLLPKVESVPMQESALRRLLTADIFELRYQDLGWGIERLQRLAEDGI